MEEIGDAVLSLPLVVLVDEELILLSLWADNRTLVSLVRALLMALNAIVFCR